MEPRARDLRDIPPFAALPRSERIALSTSSRFRDWAHSERLFHAEKPGGEVAFLIRGFARLYRAASDGREVTIFIVAPGNIVNLGGLAVDVRRDVIAEAVGTARTIHIATSAFLALGSRCPSFLEEVASALLLRTDALYTGEPGSPTAPLAARVFDILHRVTRPVSPPPRPAAIQPLTHRLTQAEIARFVGAHRSSVARALGALEEQGLVRRERGRVTGVREPGAEEQL